MKTINIGKYKVPEDDFYYLAIKHLYLSHIPKAQIRNVVNFDALTKKQFAVLVKLVEIDMDFKVNQMKSKVEKAVRKACVPYIGQTVETSKKKIEKQMNKVLNNLPSPIF